MGKGNSKKRRPYCNDKDRYSVLIWKDADFELVLSNVKVYKN